MTRKDFIRGGGRIFILLLMGTGVGFLTLMRRISLNGYCGDPAACAVCRLNRVCIKPANQTAGKDGEQRT